MNYVDMEMIESRDVLAVFLDGREQTYCIAANALDGWVERYLTDERGPVLGPNGKDATERVYGHVVIRWKAAALARMAAPSPNLVDYSQITREIVGR